MITQLTDDRAPAEERKNALGAGTRNHHNLEESVLDRPMHLCRVEGEHHCTYSV
jgi:hypothetical protein